METVTSTEIQNRFGEYLEKSRREPIQITRSGRPAAVMISPEDYAMFQALEDGYWLERAKEARLEEDVDPVAFEAYLRRRLGNAE